MFEQVLRGAATIDSGSKVVGAHQAALLCSMTMMMRASWVLKSLTSCVCCVYLARFLLSSLWRLSDPTWEIRLLSQHLLGTVDEPADYIMPFFIIAYILSQYEVFEVQVSVIAFYIIVYCLPVAFVVFAKVDLFTSSTAIEKAFCFKPARKVRFTEANIYQLAGFFFEWIQHVLYVLPVGVVTGQTQAKVQDYPPYLPFSVYFWLAVSATFGFCFDIIFNAVLRGKAHYRFRRANGSGTFYST